MWPPASRSRSRRTQIRRDGWAIECRINAEDPLRNFLPSTGRLVRYQPPEQNLFAAEPVAADAYGVRVDSGVYEGGEIPLHYDSMICKLIVHGRDRGDAIARMREALNAFVIRGVASNVAFQSALLAEPRFAAGDFNTGFIAERYPQGFQPATVDPAQPDFLIALAAAAHRRVLDRTALISGQLPGHELRIGEDYVVVTTDAAGRRDETPVVVRARPPGFDVTLRGKTWPVAFASPLRDTVVRGEFAGVPFCAQVERIGLELRVSHDGAQIDARVLSPRAAELNALMPFKAPPDLSKFLLSPMPGLLVDVAVQPGQAVRAGERLAVIEAMKMENILVAAHDCVVAAVQAEKGASLAVDQVILEFE